MSAGPPDGPSPLVRRTRLAGVLLALGLLIEAATLFSSAPTTFLIFLLAGGSLAAAGSAVYLYSLFDR